MEKTQILIVEDASIVARDIQDTLEKLGYQVSGVVASGEAAVQHTIKRRPDLILMDIVLQGELDGIEAADRIRAQHDVPIVFLTAYEDEQTLQRAKITEPFGFILKPFKERELDIGIQIALYKHRVEAQLRESEERFRRIVETAYEGIWIIDEDNKTTFLNDKMAGLLGYAPAQVLEQSLFAFVDEAWLPCAKEKLARHRQGVQEQYEIRFRRADGSDLWTIVNASPILDNEGQYGGTLAMITDITMNKRAEERLQESESRLRSIFENAAVGIALLDSHERFLDVNDAWCRMLGYRREELLGLTFREITPREETVLSFHSLDAHGNGQSYHRLERRFLRKDRHEFWGDLSVTVLSDGDGSPDRMLGIIVDITERKKAEAALKESEAKFRSLAEQSPNMIFINQRGRVTYANVKCEELMGYSREELYRPDFDFSILIAPDSLDRIKENFRKHMRGQEVAPYEYALVTKDAQKIEALITTKLIRYEGESAILGIVTDITERVQVEEALQQHNRSLQLLNQVSQALIATLDLSHIFERLLRAAVEIAGAKGSSVWLWDEDRPGELVCRAIYHQGEFRSPRDLRLGPGRGIAGWVAQKGDSAIVTNAQRDSRFFSGVDRKIDFRTTSLLAVPLRMREHIHGVLEVVNKQGDSLDGNVAGFDAEDRVLVEMLAASAAIAIDNARLIDALRQYGMELEARNQDLDAFAHTVAHDLKNPLAYMVGFAELLEEDAGLMPPEAVRRYLHTIAQNGRKMTNIIDELLLLAGVRQLEQVALVPLNMAEIVADAQRRIGDLIEENQAQISLPNSWPPAQGHGPWVEEVWVNYISNAVKYGGSPPRVELGANREDDGSVRFWVRDNGPGLTAEEQARLFTSFERLDRVRAKGHGLGLSIARRIVEKLGGQVGVASRTGRGSVFFFTLPAADTK
jgi:PAS domain S-box-containing protein